MKTLLLAGACVVLVSGSALACRGTTEFPEAFQKLENSSLPPGQAMLLRDELGAAQALHEDAHHQGDMEKMGEAIRILDSIKLKIHE